MIRLFGVTDTLFSSNGDIVLHPLKAEVHCTDNGQYYLDFESGLEYADELTEGRIIIAPTPDGDQGFRIHNPKKTRTKVSFKAKHLFYDSENILIRDSYAVNMNANGALTYMNEATEPTSPFTVLSDIQDVHSIRIVRKSLNETFKLIQERYGGHYVRNNWSFSLLDHIGTDNGVIIRYAKNLKNITCQDNWDNVVTKILPVGKDGITLPEVYLISPTQYDVPYTKSVTFQQDINKDDYTTEDAYISALVSDLRSKALDYLIKNSVPQVSYTVDANIDKVSGLGDIIQVIDERLGVSILTSVTSYVYDSIQGKYKSFEFGNYKKTVQDLMSTVRATAESVSTETEIRVTTQFDSELQRATDSIWNAMSSSYVIYDTDKILVVDRLPKEEAVNCMIINSGGIGFSNSGIAPDSFRSAWTIDGTFDASVINVINLSASIITTGIIQDKTGTNYWNLDTGDMRLTGVDVGVGARNYVRNSNTMDFSENVFAWNFLYNGDQAIVNGNNLEVLYNG